jgi:ribosomal protein L11 methylase PrmA
MIHIHLHAKMQKRYQRKGDKAKVKKSNLPKKRLMDLVDSLEALILPLEIQSKDSAWGDYYSFTNYTDMAFEHKKNIIGAFIDQVKPSTVWDLGANDGTFSRLEQLRDAKVISFDIDPIAVEKNYQHNKKDNLKNIMPLVADLTNPTPPLGWSNTERRGLLQRCDADLVLALALIHHLAIANNIPLPLTAEFFAGITHHLIVEFVPKEDSQVQKLLSSRKDIFGDYNEPSFERAYAKRFKIVHKRRLHESNRVLYLFEKLNA